MGHSCAKRAWPAACSPWRKHCLDFYTHRCDRRSHTDAVSLYLLPRRRACDALHGNAPLGLQSYVDMAVAALKSVNILSYDAPIEWVDLREVFLG